MGSSSSRTKFDHTIVVHLEGAASSSSRYYRHNEVDWTGVDVPFVDFDTILTATDNFSNSNKLGQGGFGPVYKGIFRGGQEMAVKRLSRSSGQGLEEFRNEVLLIAKLQHRNLVKLLGYCIKEEEKVLLYEYMPNKSLDSFIFDRTLCLLINWEKRLDIILGIARGILYLHQDSRLRIIHRDLKTRNILLDAEMNPKISGFGFARICEGTETEGSTDRIVGTIGYMAPEYALHGIFSVKSDVYSFGVVLLEIISGKKNSGFDVSEDFSSLIGYAWRLWNENKVFDFIDDSLCEACNAGEVLKCIQVGLLCVQEDANDRPTMFSAVSMLGETPSIPTPKQPAFLFRRNQSSTTTSSSTPESCSKPTFYGESITHSNMTKREIELDQCNTSSDGYNIRANESLQFDLSTIRNATNNFSASNKIGGGFSNVYKGVFSGQEIAVKRVSSLENFKNEVMLMHRLRLQHPNVVRVLGFYLEGEEKILIHEYVPNRSLDNYLFDNIKGLYLDWERRYEVIGDIARGLLYLHEGSRFKIIHRDLKSQNILLDGAMNAKIADFSLAMLFVHHQKEGRTSRIAGTLGYMAPEYIREGLISVKSDVFSFGILILEIVSGLKTNAFHHLYPEYTHLEYVWKHWIDGLALDRLVDPTLHDNVWKDEVMRCIHIGLLCVQENVEDRPTMSSVVGMLNDHSLTLETPSQPAFCPENSSNIATRETDFLTFAEDSCAQSCNISPLNP